MATPGNRKLHSRVILFAVSPCMYVLLIILLLSSNTTNTTTCDYHDDDQEEEEREQESLLTMEQYRQRQRYKRRHHGNHHFRLPCYRHQRPFCGKMKSECHKSQGMANWKKRLHFVELPVFELGNWIPYILNHWQCFGSSCALPQITIKTKAGN